MAFTTYTYDEGESGELVLAAGTDQIGGTPIYSTPAAVHGGVGVSMTGSGQYLRYVVGAANSGSIYVSMPVNPGTSVNRILTWGTAANGTNVSFRFHSDGTMSITDGTGTQVGASSATTWAVADPAENPDPDQFRFDWQYNEIAPGNVNLTVRIFKNANTEGTTPNETMTRTAIAGSVVATNRLRVSSSTTGWTTELDTLRLSPLTEWAGPYGEPPPPDPFTVYDFEEGGDGGAVGTGYGRDSVTGTPLYEADAKMHGAMGLRMSATGSFVRYVITAITSGSLFVTMPTNPASSANRFLVWGSSANGSHATLRMHSNGTFSIVDVAGVQVGAATTTTWVAGDTFRFDWQFNETAVGTSTVTVRIFKNTNREGTVPDEEIVRTPTGHAAATTRLRIAQSTASWVTNVDTLRIKNDVLEWAGPYGTPPPPAPFTLYNFEEGEEGDSVPTGDGVDQIGGTPIYRAAAKVHGYLGVEMTGSGQYLRYIITPISSGSIYSLATTNPGTSSNRILTWGSSANGTAVSLRYHTNGSFSITDVTNAQVGTQSTTTWLPMERFRFDWQFNETAIGNLRLIVRIFKGLNLEGTVPDETLDRTVTTSVSVTSRLRVASSTTGWTTRVDTLRLKLDALEWAGPYGEPVVPYPLSFWEWSGTDWVGPLVAQEWV